MHLVDKHIFNIEYDSESDAINMQRKIATISNEKLFALIASIFDEFDPQKTVRLDLLELELGTIRESHLEEDLLDAVAHSLRIALEEQLTFTKNAAPDSKKQLPEERNALAIFDQFMTSGSIPWWIRNRNDFDLNKTILQIFQSQMNGVTSIVRKRAKRVFFLERLVLNLNEQQIAQLIQSLAPNESSQVIEASKNIQKAHNEYPIVPAQRRGYRNKVWEFVLTYLLIDQGSVFNQKMFIQATIARLAHHFNVAYSEFLTQFYEAVQEMDEARIVPKGLVGIIKEIFNERNLSASSQSTAQPKVDAEITGIYTRLLETTSSFDSTFEAHIVTLIQANSAVFSSFLNRESSNRKLHRNLSKALTEKSLYLFVEFVEPQSKAVIIQFSNKIQDLKENSRVSISGSAREFRTNTWEFIIRALLEDRGSQFNLKSFVRSALSEIAAHFNLELHDLMHYVLLELSSNETVDKGSLEAVLLEIKEEEAQKALAEDNARASSYRMKIKFQWLEFALNNSQFPVWSERHLLKEIDFQSILFELIEDQPGDIKLLLRTHLRTNRKRHFFIQQLDQNSRHRIVRFLNARAAAKIELYDKLLDKIQERRSISANKQEFESLKWSSILEILTEDKGSFFNYKSFLQRSLLQLSNRLNIAFDVLFSYVLEVSSTLPNIPESPLQNALFEINDSLKSSLKNWSPENAPLENDLQEIWGEIKSEVPPDARMLLVLLQNLKTDSLFRSQFDLSNWLQKQTAITSEVLQKLIKALNWKVEDVTQLLSGQKPGTEQKLLQWFITNEYTAVPYYLQDLEVLLQLSKLNQKLLKRHADLFTLAYLSANATFNKHYYFTALIAYLADIIAIKPNKLLLDIHLILKSEDPSLNSTLALSLSKAIHGKSGLEESSKLEAATEELTEETMEEEELQEISDDHESIFIENAGLIIIWPFLRQFFAKLELTNEDAFTSIAASIRGVHLLQYLCTGKTAHAEYELTLNKILCGIPINIPIEGSFEISPLEKEISDSMVHGVLANWPSMEDASVEALRETFLLRAAKISFEEDTIDMHVEKKTVDVLMDRMAWSFTFVNLPWMKKPLRTIWK